MKRVVCFHLYNDFSGSPMVLKMVLSGFLKNGGTLDLMTSDGKGILNELGNDGIKWHTYHYRFSTNPIVTFIKFFWVQCYTFFFAFRFLLRKDVVFYINTLLPVGPALAGWIMRKKVIYHYHENAQAKGAFYKVLAWCMQKIATQIVCVSEYQASFLKRKQGVTVISNALSASFVSQLHPDSKEAFANKTVLMIASLKEYKGTDEFIKLASDLPEYQFKLVLNETQENIDTYLNKRNLHESDNLQIYPRQENVASFYNQSSIALNLTNPELAIETFGMTALEAMTAGLPVIVPTKGGIAEFVEDGTNGFKIDVQHLDHIKEIIRKMLSDFEYYQKLSRGALEISRKFDELNMLDALFSRVL